MPVETGSLKADRKASFPAASIFALALISAMIFPVPADAESPGVTTEAASEVTTSAATLHGKVNPHGFATTYRFEYGTTTSYGTSVPVPDKGAGSGSSSVEASETPSGLKVGTTYHFRLAAFSVEGSSYGADGTFTTTDPRFSFAFGSEGEGDGQFKYFSPGNIAIDSTGDLFVADPGHHRIQKFNAEGKYLSKFGTEGAGEGEFSYPHGIAVDSEDNIYVTDDGNHRIQKFNAEGEYLSQFGSYGLENGQFDNPYDIMIDSTGNIWVLDIGNAGYSRVEKFNAEGEYLLKFGTKGSGNGQLISATGIAVDAKGDIYVADSGNHRIQKFNAEGEYLSQFGTYGSEDGKFIYPLDVAIDAGEKIWVVDDNNHRVQGFNAEGEYLSKFGTIGGGDAQFLYPTNITTGESGDVWVADGNNRRVQKWIPLQPITTTKAASGVTKGAATLHATVNPNEFATTYRFEYGPTAAYGTSVPIPDKAVGSGSSGVEVSEGISGLKASTTYHFRVVATSAEGAGFGKDETFTTK